MSGAFKGQIAALTARAVENIRLERWDAAEHTVGQLLKIDRQDPDGLHMMGLVRVHQGKPEEAEGFYRHSLRRKPEQAYVHVSLARLLAQTGRLPQAITDLRAAIRAVPNNADLHLLLGQMQQSAGELEFAERNLRAALALKPDDPMAVQSLCAMLHATARTGEAEALLRATLARELPPAARALLDHTLAVLTKAPKD